ncbi:MAG: prolipoprotein diacylglyceryl transferase, partial [Candidatus Dormibacteraceae bacterium]
MGMLLVITIPFSPILLQLGPLAIRWYGVGYAVAFLLGLWVASRHLKRYGMSEHDYGDLAFWSIVIGLIAARLYYVVQSNAGFYLTHPAHILAFWEGGMAYFGPLFTIPILIFLYCRWKKLSLWPVLDAAALFAAIGQPIGRIGNLFNGDIIGYPSTLPWATSYTNPLTFAPAIGVSYQPAAAYELLLGLAILGLLLLLRRWGKARAGALFLAYLALYSISQFGVFFLRQNEIIAWGLKQAQFSAIALALITIILWLIWRRTTTKPTEAEPLPTSSISTVETDDLSPDAR